MKFKAIALIWLPAIGSPPARGAWIEMGSARRDQLQPMPSPPARGAWIEIVFTICL